MAFFDSFSKKVTQMGQTTIQKTKEFAEVTKINSLIDGEEKKITSTYTVIGKMYRERHESDAEEGLAEEIAKILEAEEMIAGYKKQIEEIKGFIHCEKCGAEIPLGSAFCASCGTPVPVVETKEADESSIGTDQKVGIIHCTKCGTEIQAGSAFCTACGTPAPVGETKEENK